MCIRDRSLTDQYLSDQGYNVFSLDLPGHGNSEGESLKSIELMAEWLNKVITKLNIKNIIILGHSQGCLVALEFVNNLSALIFILILAVAIYFSPQRQALEALNFDLLTVLSTDQSLDESLVIIGIDDQSFANLNAQWPWPRGIHAHLLEQIKKQKPLE